MSKIWFGIKKCIEWLWVGFAVSCLLSVFLGFCLGFCAMICDVIFGCGKSLVPIVLWMIFPRGFAFGVGMCLAEWIGGWGEPNHTYGGGYTGCGSSDGSDDNYPGGPTPGYGGSI